MLISQPRTITRTSYRETVFKWRVIQFKMRDIKVRKIMQYSSQLKLDPKLDKSTICEVELWVAGWAKRISGTYFYS